MSNEIQLETPNSPIRVSDLKAFADNFSQIIRPKDGQSAYDIWIEEGNQGTKEDFLNSLKGNINDDTTLKNNIALNLSAIGFTKKNLFKSNQTYGSITTVNDTTFTISNNDLASFIVNTPPTGAAATMDYYIRGEYNSTEYNIFPEGNLTINVYNLPAGCSVRVISNGTTKKNYLDASDPSASFISSNEKGKNYITGIMFRIPSGTILSNANIKIMVRYSDITDDTYEPYQDDLQTQINALIARIEALENK